jgi:hypothetical protein
MKVYCLFHFFCLASVVQILKESYPNIFICQVGKAPTVLVFGMYLVSVLDGAVAVLTGFYNFVKLLKSNA